jgi:hypothetical protein
VRVLVVESVEAPCFDRPWLTMRYASFKNSSMFCRTRDGSMVGGASWLLRSSLRIGVRSVMAVTGEWKEGAGEKTEAVYPDLRGRFGASIPLRAGAGAVCDFLDTFLDSDFQSNFPWSSQQPARYLPAFAEKRHSIPMSSVTARQFIRCGRGPGEGFDILAPSGDSKRTFRICDYLKDSRTGGKNA